MTAREKKTTKAMLAETATMLADVNGELQTRMNEVPEDVRLLMAQKGALTQCVLREMRELVQELQQAKADTEAKLAELELASPSAPPPASTADKSEVPEAYEELLHACLRWRESFFEPLRTQCQGKRLEDPIDTNDLEELMRELDGLLLKTGWRV